MGVYFITSIYKGENSMKVNNSGILKIIEEKLND